MTELKLKFGSGFVKRTAAIAMAVILGVSMLPGTTFGADADSSENESDADVTLADLTVTPSTAEIEVDGEVSLTAAFDVSSGDVSGGDVTAGDLSQVTWSSNNEEVATVSGEGETATVTGVKAGTAEITAEYENSESKKTAVCKITVEGAQDENEVTKIELNKTSLTLKKGNTEQLIATTTPTDATVTWSSNDEDVAIVNNGVVEAVGVGETVITATAGGMTADCTITVEEAQDVTLADLTVTPSTAEIEVDGTVELKASFDDVADDDVTAGDLSQVTWSSNNEEVATVSGEGETATVTGVKAGNAEITAEYDNNGSKKTAVCEITVKEAHEDEDLTVTVKSISLDKQNLALKQGEKATLTATTDPAGQTVTWTSSDDKVAKVTNGTVEAVAKGEATITATAGGETATCTVTVTEDETPQSTTPSETEDETQPTTPSETVTSLKLNKTSLTLAKGQSSTLKATVSPSTAELAWSTSNESVATVSNGKVKAVKAGTATITVKAGSKKATCKVTVKNPSVKLTAASAALQVGKSTTAIKVAEKFPSNDTVKSWKSSNTKIAKVNSKGKITAQKKTGKATITVTMKSGAKATCKVTVQSKKVTTKSLKLNKTKLTLKKGKSETLKVTRNPITATEKITWSTSNKKVATVNSKGKVSAKKKGTAKITVKSSNGKKATCKVTVK